MSRNHRRRTTAILSGLLLLASAGAPAGAQMRDGGGGGQPVEEQSEGMLGVAFPGGTVGEYVEALRMAVRPAPANVAVSESAASAMLPPIRLDRVSMGTALAAIEYIAPTGPDENWVIASLDRLGNGPEAFAVTLVRSPVGFPGQPGMTSGAVPPGRDRMLKVFSIKELIDPPPPGGGGAETVLSAVQLALEMDSGPGEQAPDLKFHPDSSLLILDGSPQQVSAISELLSRMLDDAQRARDRADRVTRQRQEDATAVRIAEAKLVSSEFQVKYLKDAFTQARSLRDQGAASDEEVRIAEMNLTQVLSQNTILRAELDAVMARASASQAPPPTTVHTETGQTEALRDQVLTLRQQVVTLEAKIKELEARKK